MGLSHGVTLLVCLSFLHTIRCVNQMIYVAHELLTLVHSYDVSQSIRSENRTCLTKSFQWYEIIFGSTVRTSLVYFTLFNHNSWKPQRFIKRSLSYLTLLPQQGVLRYILSYVTFKFLKNSKKYVGQFGFSTVTLWKTCP